MTTATLTASQGIGNQGATRLELRRQVAQYFGFHHGVVASGSTTTIVDAALSRYADDYWNNASGYMVDSGGSAPQGEEFWVTDFVSATGTITISPLTASVAPGDVFELYKRTSHKEITDAINNVVRGETMIGTITPEAGTAEYLAACDGLTFAGQISSVEYYDASQAIYVGIEWQARQTAGLVFLFFPALSTPETGDKIIIHYMSGPGGMKSDGAMTAMPAALVRTAAIVRILENSLLNQDGQGMEKIGAALRDMREQQVAEAAQHMPRPGRVVVHAWRRTRRVTGASRLFDNL